jgi:hypothetical protein
MTTRFSRVAVAAFVPMTASLNHEVMLEPRQLGEGYG